MLVKGRWAEGKPAAPVPWPNTYNGGRVFYTTLGHPDDFKIEAFSQLLLGGITTTLNHGIVKTGITKTRKDENAKGKKRE